MKSKLEEYTIEQLQDEINSRNDIPRPKPLSMVDLTKVYSGINEYLVSIDSDDKHTIGEIDDAYYLKQLLEHPVFENLINALYPEGTIGWINKRLYNEWA